MLAHVRMITIVPCSESTDVNIRIIIPEFQTRYDTYNVKLFGAAMMILRTVRITFRTSGLTQYTELNVMGGSTNFP